MATDPAPLVGFATAMAWVSLVTVEFYERIYRDRIEKNETKLKQYSEAKRKELIREIEKDLADSEGIPGFLDRINKVSNAKDSLRFYRAATFLFLFVSLIASFVASIFPGFEFFRMYAPDPRQVPSGSPLEKGVPVTSTAVAYLLLFFVFLLGFLFLKEMFWFDKLIDSEEMKKLTGYRWGEGDS